MPDESSVRAAEAEFFSALVGGDTGKLDRLLAADFTLIATNGMVISKAELIGAIGGGILVFDRIDPVSSMVRSYGGTSVVTGQTKMSARFAGMSSQIDSLYTHVYVQMDGRLQFVSAQGTPVPRA
jgi:Domain of unknown function (DUF4440)